MLAGKEHVCVPDCTDLPGKKKMLHTFDVKNYLQPHGANQLGSKIKNLHGIGKEAQVNIENKKFGLGFHYARVVHLLQKHFLSHW